MGALEEWQGLDLGWDLVVHCLEDGVGVGWLGASKDVFGLGDCIAAPSAAGGLVHDWALSNNISFCLCGGSLEVFHGVLQGRKDSSLDVEGPCGLSLIRAHISDLASGQGKAECVQFQSILEIPCSGNLSLSLSKKNIFKLQ